MKNTTCNAAEIWKQFEDLLVPQLGLSVVDRAAYSHLLRHSRLEGRVRLRFSILWLALGIGLSSSTARDAVRRLVNYGALRLLARTKSGHLVEVRLPGEIRGIRAHGKWAGLPAAAAEPNCLNGFFLRSGRLQAGNGGHASTDPNIDHDIENLDFMQSRALRKAIHVRERGQCFYCLRRLTSGMQALDHVVPRAQSGRNSYRNLVSCCLECNSRKGETPAGDFLRWLFREGRLTPAELTDRLRALEDLASGKLLPALEGHCGHLEPGFSLPIAAKGPASFPPALENHAGHVDAGGIHPGRVESPASPPPASCSQRAYDVAAAFRRAPLECSLPRAKPSGGLLTLILEGQQLFRHPQFPAMAEASGFTETGSHQAPAETASISTTALAASPDSPSVSTTTLAEMERMTILRAFEQARGDKALAGKILGISRATLYRKLKRYNIAIKPTADDAEPQPPNRHHSCPS